MLILGKTGFGCALLLGASAMVLPAQNLDQPSPSSSSYSAPIELINDKPYVSVMVNGRGPFRFMIDTGTGGQALVSPGLADELALPVVGHARLTDPSGQGGQRSDVLLMQSLKIGGAEFTEVRGIRHRLYEEEENCRGVLGFALFRDYLFTLDYPDRKLIMARGEVAQDSGGSVLPFRMKDGVPIVTLRIDGQHVEAQIDSGGTGLSLPEALAARLKFVSTPVAFGSVESLSTRFQIKAARLRPDVRMGRYAFKQSFIEINPAFPLVNIGSTPLEKFIVTFDQAKLLVRFYSNQTTLRLDASPSQLQLTNEPKREASDPKLVPVG